MLIMSSYSQKDFENKTKIKHGEKYDLPKTVYTNSRSKATVICHKLDKNGKEQGVWMSQASNFLHGCGYPNCNASHLETETKKLLKSNINFEQ